MRFFFLRVGGLPYVWASQAEIPPNWDAGGIITIGWDDYTWSPTLSAPQGTIDDEVEAFAGIPACALHPVEPEGASGFFTEVPRHHFADTFV